MSEDLYARYVELGRGYRKAGDTQKWEFGRASSEFCLAFDIDLKRGRPAKDDDGPTLKDYARDVGEDTRVVSATVLTHRFYPDNVRTRGDFADLSWRHFNRAREASGGELDNAVELLEQAVTLHLGPNDFTSWLAGEYVSMPMEYSQLSEYQRGFIPTSRAGDAVYVMIRRLREGE